MKEYRQWLYRQDLNSLWGKIPKGTKYNHYILSQVAKYEETIGANLDLFGKKFKSGLLSYDTFVWDPFYKRVIVDVIVCDKYELDLNLVAGSTAKTKIERGIQMIEFQQKQEKKRNDAQLTHYVSASFAILFMILIHQTFMQDIK